MWIWFVWGFSFKPFRRLVRLASSMRYENEEKVKKRDENSIHVKNEQQNRSKLLIILLSIYIMDRLHILLIWELSHKTHTFWLWLCCSGLCLRFIFHYTSLFNHIFHRLLFAFTCLFYSFYSLSVSFSSIFVSSLI